MIKKETIRKSVQAIAKLRTEATNLIIDSIDNFKFVTEKVQSKVDKLEGQAKKKADQLIKKLMDAGLCANETGLTYLEAKHSIFEGIDNLWDIGDGWC